MSQKLSSMDPNLIVRAQHDEESNAQRVVLVGGDFGIADAVKQSLKDMKIEVNSAPVQQLPVKQQDPFVFEKEVIVKEYEVLKIPEIVKEYEIKVIEIEKPVIVSETKLIEVPVIQTKIEYVDRQVIVKEVNDKYVKALLIVQSLGLLATIIKLFL